MRVRRAAATSASATALQQYQRAASLRCMRSFVGDVSAQSRVIRGTFDRRDGGCIKLAQRPRAGPNTPQSYAGGVIIAAACATDAVDGRDAITTRTRPGRRCGHRHRSAALLVRIETLPALPAGRAAAAKAVGGVRRAEARYSQEKPRNAGVWPFVAKIRPTHAGHAATAREERVDVRGEDTDGSSGSAQRGRAHATGRAHLGGRCSSLHRAASAQRVHRVLHLQMRSPKHRMQFQTWYIRRCTSVPAPRTATQTPSAYARTAVMNRH